MAYGQQSYNRNSAPAPKAAAPAAAGGNKTAREDLINVAGVFVYTNRETGKPSDTLLYTGKVKEDVVIPAGSTIKVFKKGGLSKNGKQLPELDIVAQKARGSK